MQMTFPKAFAQFFGKKPGQDLREFMAELKALTPEDLKYFRREFLKIGIEIEG